MLGATTLGKEETVTVTYNFAYNDHLILKPQSTNDVAYTLTIANSQVLAEKVWITNKNEEQLYLLFDCSSVHINHTDLSTALLLNGRSISYVNQGVKIGHHPSILTLPSGHYLLATEKEHLRLKPTNTEASQKIEVLHLTQNETTIEFYLLDDQLALFHENLVAKRRKAATLYPFQYAVEKFGPLWRLRLPITQHKDVMFNGYRLDFFLQISEEELRPIVSRDFIHRSPSSRYFEPVEIKDETQYLAVYSTKAGQLSFIYNTLEKIMNESLDEEATLQRLNFKDGKMQYTVALKKAANLKASGMIWRLRKGTAEQAIIVPITAVQEKGESLLFSFQLDVRTEEWDQFYWDAYLMVENAKNETYEIRITNYRLRIRLRLQYLLNHNEYNFEDGHFLVPYITIANGFSLNYRLRGEFEARKYKRNEYIAVILHFFFGWLFWNRKIWLMHEKMSETAQDNSYYFFKYCFEKHPEQKVYYVIREDSEDYKRLAGMEKRVLKFMSVKHLFYLLACQMIVSSEAKGHGFAWRVSKGFIRPTLNAKPYVFLQHGVLGLKRIDSTFDANGMNDARLFVTSSDFEKEIVMQNLGYEEERVIVTGLARWDALYEEKTIKDRSIMFMPTWRNWLEEVTAEEFLASDYYQEYSKVLHSEKLIQYLETENWTLNFYLHPKFIEFAGLFESPSPNIRLLQFGEEPVNKLIRQSSLLITDYSSVAWEALYQDIPVVFFQFDQEQYMECQGAYMDLKTELFGIAVKTAEDLISSVKKPEENTSKSNYFKYIDNNNAKRIFSEIVTIVRQGELRITFKERIRKSIFLRAVYRKMILLKTSFIGEK